MIQIAIPPRLAKRFIATGLLAITLLGILGMTDVLNAVNHTAQWLPEILVWLCGTYLLFLLAFCLIDLALNDTVHSKFLWFIVILVLTFLGVLGYLWEERAKSESAPKS